MCSVAQSVERWSRAQRCWFNSYPEALENFSQLVPVGSWNVYLSDTRIYLTLKFYLYTCIPVKAGYPVRLGANGSLSFEPFWTLAALCCFQMINIILWCSGWFASLKTGDIRKRWRTFRPATSVKAAPPVSCLTRRGSYILNKIPT